jgi:tetratricopeptide (TPR) repeat protein
MQFKTWQAFIVAASLLLAPLPAWAGANLQQLLQMGADALKTGNSFLATQKYQEAVDKNPNSHQAWYALAEAQYKSQNFKAAIKSVSKALGLAPDRPLVLAKYHTGRAWACYKAGLYGQAVTDMERATELAPNNRQYKKWLNGARQKEQQKGPGPSLSSVLGYEEMPRSSGGDSERTADREREQEQTGDDYSQPYNEDDEETASQNSSESERYQDEDQSERQAQEEESSRQERYQEEQESDSKAQGEDDGGDILSSLPPRCRKSYFVCMAGCADIQSADSRSICENACTNAAKACR